MLNSILSIVLAICLWYSLRQILEILEKIIGCDVLKQSSIIKTKTKNL
jgi:hypothetical protein